jgi:translation initiation factor 6 (eIF-6)
VRALFIYLGTIAGIILGGVAGLLAVKGFLITPLTPAPTVMQLIYEAFIVGLALKGVTEAAGGQPLRQAASGS